MKIGLIFLFAFFLLSCQQSNIADSKPDAEQLQTKTLELKPVLEIRQNAKGLWNITGEILFFRLYQNGVVEFEVYDKNKIIQEKRNQAEEIAVLKRVQIEEKELQALLDAIMVEKINSISEKITRKCCCTDAFLDYNLNFQNRGSEKKIELKGYCDFGELTNPVERNLSGFPPALSELMGLINKTRLKYSA